MARLTAIFLLAAFLAGCATTQSGPATETVTQTVTVTQPAAKELANPPASECLPDARPTYAPVEAPFDNGTYSMLRLAAAAGETPIAFEQGLGGWMNLTTTGGRITAQLRGGQLERMWLLRSPGATGQAEEVLGGILRALTQERLFVGPYGEGAEAFQRLGMHDLNVATLSRWTDGGSGLTYEQVSVTAIHDLSALQPGASDEAVSAEAARAAECTLRARGQVDLIPKDGFAAQGTLQLGREKDALVLYDTLQTATIECGPGATASSFIQVRIDAATGRALTVDAAPPSCP